MILDSLRRYEPKEPPKERVPEKIKKSDSSNISYPKEKSSVSFEFMMLMRAIAVGLVIAAAIVSVAWFTTVSVNTYIGGAQ